MSLKRPADGELPAPAAKVRALDVVEREYDEANRASRRLETERSSHPDFIMRQEHAARQRVLAALPAAIHNTFVHTGLPGIGKLKKLELEDRLDYSTSDSACEAWSLLAVFEKGTIFSVRCEHPVGVPPDLDVCHTVDFHPDPVRLWHRALDANDDDEQSAFIAFCDACCASMNDYNESPARAFARVATSKGKKETTES